MISILISLGSIVLLGLAFAIWLKGREKRAEKRAVDEMKLKIEIKRRDTKKKVEKVQSERRDEKQTLDRLDDGTF